MKKGESWCLKDATNDALLQREQLHLSIAEENAAIAQEKIRSITGKGSGSTPGEAVEAARKEVTVCPKFRGVKGKRIYLDNDAIRKNG